MKILLLTLTLLLAFTQAFGQRKSKVDPRDTKIDSLTKASKTITLQLDSVSGELVKYTGMYDVLKEKVIHYNFDPARTGFLIDSLKASRDSAFLLLTALPKPVVTNDSLAMFMKNSTILKAKIDSIMIAWEQYKSDNTGEEVERAKAISSLQQLKELVSAKIITEAEYVSLKKKYLSKL